MSEIKIGGSEISLMTRSYFEHVFNTNMMYFEIIKINFNEQNKIWNVEVEAQPLYLNEGKRYRLEIDADGNIKNVEQIPSAKK